MASWEKLSYANPGDIVSWPSNTIVGVPLFERISKDIAVVPRNTHVMVVATFPEGSEENPTSRGAIILVPHRGLWWWQW